MTRRTYAEAITKDYLKKLGIEHVSTDGRFVIKNGKVAHICVNKKAKRPYGYVFLYDPDIRASVPVEERTNQTGSLTLGIHVINYVWNKEDKSEGMVIDHIDNDPTNNDISNLQCVTQQENLTKERTNWNTREIHCKLDRPRSYYENKLAYYESLYTVAKQEHNAELCHKLRANISQTKARIRYWDSHHNSSTEKDTAQLSAKKQSVKDIKILTQYKQMFRENGNKAMWHQVCSVINNWDSFDSKQKEHIFEVLTKHFSLSK